MTTRMTLNDGTERPYVFGLGLGELDGRRRVSHGGGINGFSSSLAYFPDDGVVVAALANGRTKLEPVVEKVARAALGLRAPTGSQSEPAR